MRMRELFGGDPDPAPDAPSGPTAEQQRLLQRASELVAAGDEAIRRALSIDSEAYLSANRQEGGQ